MVALIKVKLKGTTIIEAIIAFVIVLLSFGICISMYTKSISSKNSNIAFRALIKVKEISAKTKIEGKYVDEQFMYDNITYKKSISVYSKSETLFVLKIEACDQNNLVFVRTQEIIPIVK